jgi:hypothetical protein
MIPMVSEKEANTHSVSPFQGYRTPALIVICENEMGQGGGDFGKTGVFFRVLDGKGSKRRMICLKIATKRLKMDIF